MAELENSRTRDTRELEILENSRYSRTRELEILETRSLFPPLSARGKNVTCAQDTVTCTKTRLAFFKPAREGQWNARTAEIP